MDRPPADSDHWTAQCARNTAQLRWWAAAWCASTALAAFGPKLLWDFNTPLTVAAVLINLSVGIGMIMATTRYLRGLDEMQQKIFLNAGTLTLGVGLVCGLSYDLLEDVRLIGFEPAISHLVILMALTFVASTIYGHGRYR